MICSVWFHLVYFGTIALFVLFVLCILIASVWFYPFCLIRFVFFWFNFGAYWPICCFWSYLTLFGSTWFCLVLAGSVRFNWIYLFGFGSICFNLVLFASNWLLLALLDSMLFYFGSICLCLVLFGSRWFHAVYLVRFALFVLYVSIWFCLAQFDSLWSSWLHLPCFL